MLISQHALRRISNYSIVCVMLACTFSINTKAQGQSIEPPPGQGAPKGTVGGGARTDTTFYFKTPSQVAERLKSLSFEAEPQSTSTNYSSFWLYLPTSATQTLSSNLFDAKTHELSQATSAIPQWAGSSSLNSPDAPEPSWAQQKSETATLTNNFRNQAATNEWFKQIELSESPKPPTVADTQVSYEQREWQNKTSSALAESRQIAPIDLYSTAILFKLLNQTKATLAESFTSQ